MDKLSNKKSLKEMIDLCVKETTPSSRDYHDGFAEDVEKGMSYIIGFFKGINRHYRQNQEYRSLRSPVRWE